MTTLLLKAWTLDEYFDEGAWCASVEISPEAAETLLKRLDKVAALKREDPSVYCTEYWDYRPEWYQYNEQLEELADGLDDGCEVLAEPLDTGQLEGVRDECTRLVVTSNAGGDDVWWRSYVKHTSIQMETACVSRSLLEQIGDGAGVGEAH